jgi:DUF2933 family protein
MTLIAVSGLGALVPIVFALACPLMMIFMMRGHGHGAHGHGAHGHAGHSRKSLEELKAERDELNEEIGHRAEQTVAR